MLKTLYSYLIQRKSIFLPGIGHFRVLTGEYQYDAADQLLYPAQPVVVMTDEQPPVQKELFTYISRRNGVSELEAIQQFNNCIFEMRQQIKSGKPVEWFGIGIISAGNAPGETVLVPYNATAGYLPPVEAYRVVRQNRQHPVLVGDEQTDVVEMQERLFGEKPKKPLAWYWWATILAAVGLAALGYYLYTAGRLPAFANGQLL